ncbi:hypothetical protein J6590_039988 [Homalodisca vitripennis]|nr:hypothetical protein J6590_039988 [Homalodisca vitripennis]
MLKLRHDKDERSYCHLSSERSERGSHKLFTRDCHGSQRVASSWLGSISGLGGVRAGAGVPVGRPSR